MKVLIIGNGYAGSLLTYFLVKNNVEVTLIDRDDNHAASRVSTGIMLPVTGRRLAKTHNADVIIPFARETYFELCDHSGIRCFNDKKVLQLFSSPCNMNEWFARSDDPGFEKYTGDILTKGQISTHIKNEFGGIILQQSGFVDSKSLIEAVRIFGKDKLIIHSQDFKIDEFELSEYGVNWKDTFYDFLIFCEGFESTKNKFFNYIPFKPAKGELLNIAASDLDDTYILNGPVFILPVGDGRFRVGSTYSWTDLTPTPTPEACESLENGLRSMISCDYKITNQQAGIRPSISDRRPVIGLHPEHKQLGIFNGLGTKGAMQGPLYASQFCSLLLEGKDPDSDVDIRRFESLYRAH